MQGGPKNWHTFLYALTFHVLTSSNVDRFSNLFQHLNQENICNNTVPKDPTDFNKLTTGNNVFIVSLII